jgi:hypothetical protein
MKASFLSFFLTLVLGGLASQNVQKTTGYDGKWWLSVDSQQRTGFVVGYLVYYRFDTQGEVKFENSILLYVTRVNGYLRDHPDEQGKSIEDLLRAVNSPQQRRKGPAAGPVPHEKYSIYDGEYWRESSLKARLGFVQGFLDCYSRYGGGKKGTFPKLAEQYDLAITKWYEITDDGDINAEKSSEKIPNVLFRLADPPRIE